MQTVYLADVQLVFVVGKKIDCYGVVRKRACGECEIPVVVSDELRPK